MNSLELRLFGGVALAGLLCGALSCGENEESAGGADGGGTPSGDTLTGNSGAATGNEIDPDVPIDCSHLPEGEVIFELEDEEDPAIMLASGGYLYHSYWFGTNRTTIDGSDTILVSEDMVVAAFEDRIYIATTFDGIFRLDPDGNSPSSLGDLGHVQFLQDGSTVYAYDQGRCNDEESPGSIYRIDANDDVTTLLDGVPCLKMPAVGEDHIYFVIAHNDQDREENQSLYRVPKSGGSPEELPLWVDDWGGFVPVIQLTKGYVVGRPGARYVRGLPTDVEPELIAPNYTGDMGRYGDEVFISGEGCVGIVNGASPVEYIARFDANAHNIEEMVADAHYVYYTGNNYVADASVIRRFKYR